MDVNLDDFKERAREYLIAEGVEEVYSIEFVQEASSFLGKNIILLADIEDDQESECWVIGGGTPMNLYAKSQFDHPEEAHQFHVGTIAQIMKSSVLDGYDDPPEWVGYDAFICHASEDKEDFVRPLAEELQKKDFRIWYDEFELSVGDSLRESIDRGLVESAYGIVVLSESFFEKEWAKYELNGLVARQTSGEKVILPVWYEIDKQQIAEYSPPLADLVAVQANTDNVQEVAEELYVTILDDAREKMAKERSEVEQSNNDEGTPW